MAHTLQLKEQSIQTLRKTLDSYRVKVSVIEEELGHQTRSNSILKKDLEERELQILRIGVEQHEREIEGKSDLFSNLLKEDLPFMTSLKIEN
mmetsp:Transcript_15427/g.26101  ORF Transcript_15427/g.26101 Transcript_15427/m.26101 type:complete len:92 (+) Transcript_15427:1614-1889(+)